ELDSGHGRCKDELKEFERQDVKYCEDLKHMKQKIKKLDEKDDKDSTMITNITKDHGASIDDLETILVPLAHHLRPMLLNSWKERSKVAFTKNAKKMKCLLDNLQQRLDKPFLNMQLYEKALNLFEDDQSTLQYWETGGNCNMAIASARLGLHCVAIGYVGDEIWDNIFFYPGPRGKTQVTGTPEEQRALDKFLRMSDVLLLTSKEAKSLTSIGNPILAAQELLRKGVRTKWVIVKMGAKGSILITMSNISCAPAFKETPTMTQLWHSVQPVDLDTIDSSPGQEFSLETEHEQVWKHVVRKGDAVVDATCGNGYDTLVMLKMVADQSKRGRVYGMDVQKVAIESTSSLLD
ncbi:unnamed protein product, partial [Ilex paraguariensis]